MNKALVAVILSTSIVQPSACEQRASTLTPYQGSVGVNMSQSGYSLACSKLGADWVDCDDAMLCALFPPVGDERKPSFWVDSGDQIFACTGGDCAGAYEAASYHCQSIAP